MSLSGDDDHMDAGDRDSLAPTPPLAVDVPPPADNGLGPGPGGGAAVPHLVVPGLVAPPAPAAMFAWVQQKVAPFGPCQV